MGMNDYTKASAITLYSTQKLYVGLCLLAFNFLTTDGMKHVNMQSVWKQLVPLTKSISTHHTPLCVGKQYRDFTVNFRIGRTAYSLLAKTLVLLFVQFEMRWSNLLPPSLLHSPLLPFPLLHSSPLLSSSSFSF